MAQWKHIANLDELKKTGVQRVFFDSRAVALFYVEGNCYALANACPHRGGPFSEGEVIRSRVLCPWHGWAFRLSDGVCLKNADYSVETYPTKVEQGKVFLSLPAVCANSNGPT